MPDFIDVDLDELSLGQIDHLVALSVGAIWTGSCYLGPERSQGRACPAVSSNWGLGGQVIQNNWNLICARLQEQGKEFSQIQDSELLPELLKAYLGKIFAFPIQVPKCIP